MGRESLILAGREVLVLVLLVAVLLWLAYELVAHSRR